ncbi:MAG: hypothetical protein ABIA75_03970 [Candidatus Neomarinimicrobiota bacterium]
MPELLEIVKNVIAAEEVVVLEVRGDGIESPLKVVIDSELPVSLDLVTRITRILRGASEMIAQFPDGYRLQVTSPGIEAPLRFPFQYRKNINRKLKLTLSEQLSEKELIAKLTRVDETGIYVNTSNRQDLFVPFDQIINANIIISFKG